MLLPGLHPVLVRDRRIGRCRQRLDASQVIQRLLHLMPRLFQVLVRWQIGTHRDRPRGRAFIFIIHELHALFGHHPVRGKARQHV